MKMTLFLALSAFCLTAFSAVPRIIDVSTQTDEFTKVAILQDSTCPVVRYAAKELQRILERAMGVKPEIASTPSDEGLLLVLGNGPLAQKAGLDIAQLPEEGFYIRRIQNRIFLLGKDDANANPDTKRYVDNYDRATLNAVYEFLERFLGVRFYFPHDCGTIVPKRPALAIPREINILERPDMSNRMWGLTDVSSGSSLEPDFAERKQKTMFQLRYHASPYGQSNSLNKYFRFIERFGESHPEYFALMTNGKRFTDPNIRHTGHLCFESGIREEIYQDIKAYLTGQPASSRGLPFWNGNAFSPGFVTVCPQDAFYWCACEKCSKIAAPGRDLIYTNLAERQKVSDYIWQFTADLANRMKREGVPGKLIQLAYFPYNLPPKCEIPDNVQVAVALFPGIAAPDHPRMAITEAQIAPWLKIVKGGVILRAWTGKTMQRSIPYIPAMKHNYIGQYFAARRHLYAGAFIDEYSDYFMFTYLNLYLFSKMTWNQDTDHVALLDEHFNLMFGKAAPLLRQFYDDLEKIWNDEVLLTGEDDREGIQFAIPDTIELWTNIYSPARIATFAALFDKAEKLTSGEELQRVQYIRREIFGKLLEGSQTFTSNRSSVDNWKIHSGETVYLRPHRGTFNEVQTTVTFQERPDSLLFRFHCEEPFIQEVKADTIQSDSPYLPDDSDIELFLKPRKESSTYYQFVVNPNGAMNDYEYGDKATSAGLAWNSGAACTVTKSADAWEATLDIPKKAIGNYDAEGFRINLGRRRLLRPPRKVVEEYYKWAPFSGGTFHTIANWGHLVLKDDPDANLLKNPGFVGEPASATHFMGWSATIKGDIAKGQKVELDKRYFITNGQSIHLVNIDGTKLGISQRVTSLKPNTRYRLSFYIRTKDVEPRRESLYSGVYVTKGVNVHLPHNNISGTHEWTRMAFDITTPSAEQLNPNPPFGITMVAPGEVWFDEMSLIELPAK